MPNASDSRASDARVSLDAPVDVDKRTLYGEWLRNSRWKDKLHERAAAKSLDLPEDDVIHAPRTNTTTNGVGWKELAVIGALVLGAGGLGTYLTDRAAKPNQASPPPAASPADSEYDVRFYDADGNPIPIQHISQRSERGSGT